jgi:hypothetical protein
VTERARIVLADCEAAWEMLEACESKQEWRILWVAAISLARAVGDVLDKVDGENDPLMRSVSNEAYSRWKTVPEFKDLIKMERDQVIHRYETEAFGGDSVTLLLENEGESEPFGLDECMFKPLESGVFAGDDARDILKDAIEWLRSELDGIDAQVQ